jgi:hypothetical protein
MHSLGVHDPRHDNYVELLSEMPSNNKILLIAERVKEAFKES